MLHSLLRSQLHSPASDGGEERENLGRENAMKMKKMTAEEARCYMRLLILQNQNLPCIEQNHDKTKPKKVGTIFLKC